MVDGRLLDSATDAAGAGAERAEREVILVMPMPSGIAPCHGVFGLDKLLPLPLAAPAPSFASSCSPPASSSDASPLNEPKSLAVKLRPLCKRLGRGVLFFRIDGTCACAVAFCLGIRLLLVLPDDGTGADALRVGAFCGEAGVRVRMGPIEPVDARMGLAGRTGIGWSEEEVEEEVERTLRPEPIEAERSSIGEGENLVLFCKVVERL